jgi:hypothetical protein
MEEMLLSRAPRAWEANFIEKPYKIATRNKVAPGRENANHFKHSLMTSKNTVQRIQN